MSVRLIIGDCRLALVQLVLASVQVDLDAPRPRRRRIDQLLRCVQIERRHGDTASAAWMPRRTNPMASR